MSNQLSLVGEQIKQHRLLLSKNTVQALKIEGDHLFLTNYEPYPGHCLEAFFDNLGNSLCSDNPEALKMNKLYAFEWGQTAVDSEIPPENALETFTQIRIVIHDFLNDHIDFSLVTTQTIFQAMKEINYLIDQASITFIGHYNKLLSTTKFALAESSEDLKITLKELNDLKNALNESTIFAVTDKNDNIIYANDKFCEITKYTREELIGQNHSIYNSGYHSKQFFEKIWNTIQQGKVWNGEILNKAKDGSLYWVDTTIIPYQDSNGKTYQHISIQKDLTEQKRTEELLHKTEKLSLVGELAAGIAHEIRNPLTTIKGFVQLLSKSPDRQDHPYTDTILGEIDRINFIVSEFMVFAKPHATYFSRCNLTEILLSVIHLLGAEAVLKNVIIRSNFHSNELYIFGEKHQLKQVFINMIKNSIEALPDGGYIDITITTEKQYTSVSIQDNGVGMSEEQIQKLGEPFYTTKETGNGLGLMVSYKIIQNHKGEITVSSDVRSGTKFTITFPVYRGDNT
jgi:PAS domain S-box-containing protein